ncbi:MAG: hypothetical protein V1892_01545 [bacterium]
MDSVKKKSNFANKIVFLIFFLLIIILIVILINKNFGEKSLKPEITIFKAEPINKAIKVNLQATDKLGLKEMVLQLKEEKIVTDCNLQKLCSRELVIDNPPQMPSDLITLVATVTNIQGEKVSEQKVVEIKKNEVKPCEQPTDCGEIKDCGESWLCLEGFCEPEFKNCTSTENTIPSPTSTPELY